MICSHKWLNGYLYVSNFHSIQGISHFIFQFSKYNVEWRAKGNFILSLGSNPGQGFELMEVVDFILLNEIDEKIFDFVCE